MKLLIFRSYKVMVSRVQSFSLCSLGEYYTRKIMCVHFYNIILKENVCLYYMNVDLVVVVSEVLWHDNLKKKQ